MGLPLVVHVSAGAAGLVTGFTALAVAKGGTLHRRSGLIFVYVMVVMALLGASIAAVEAMQPVHNAALPPTALMGLFTAYLVVTALTAVRPPGTWTRRLDLVGLPLVAAIGIGQLRLATLTLANADAPSIGMLTIVELIFGTIALIAAASDLRILRSAPLTGARRIARHLWRMTLALWIAALSFFPRLTKVLPPSLRPLVSVPMIIVLGALIYWMWRIRYRRSFRGLIGVSAPTPVAR